MDHCQAHPCCIMKMYRISFPYDYLSSTSQGKRKIQEKITITKQKMKTKKKLNLKIRNVSECLVVLQCFVLVFDGLCGSSSITAAAKHANHERKNLDDEAHLRLLSYLDNENKISLESLEHLSPAKLIGRDKSSEEDSSNDHSNDMDSINKLLMMDDPLSSSDKSAPGIGKKF